jgi:hypothetical protein
MPTSDGNTRSIGFWTDEELEATAAQFRPVGIDSDMPEPVRFKGSVTKLVQLRHLQGSLEDELSVFILARSGEASLANFTRKPMLNNGLSVLGGRIWIVNATAGVGWYREHLATSDELLFNLITDDLLLGSLPAIIYDPRCASLRFYPNGLVDEAKYEMASTSSPVTLDTIFAHIDAIHEHEMVTPEAQGVVGKLWEDNQRWWPIKLAEQMVQFYLKVGLNRAFPRCNVRQERPQNTGRVDLLVEEVVGVNPTITICHVILELKVLRSFGSTGIAVPLHDTEDWVRKGVLQASAYRVESGANASALCCFDMRKEDTGEACFLHVATEAAALQVRLKRWYLYATSEVYRAALGAQNLNVAQ